TRFIMKNNICLFFLIVQAFLYAQDNTPPQLPKIFPPSPDVASLGKFGDIPVGYYTGVPNISVPMVTLQGKELSIPVSIAYHAGGVKVNEIASRVGIGWAINAGGAISRSTRGIPDDKGMGYLYNTAHINYLLSNPSAVDDPQAKGYLETVSQGNEDLESDIYNYNFMGYSGKFFFNNTGEIIMHPYDNVRFTPVKNGLTIIGWKAVVKDGTIFYLGVSKDGLRKANDTSTTSTMSQIGGTSFSLPFMNPNFTDFITTWQLMDIETTKGELVSYEYGSNAIEFWSLASQTNILKSSIGQMPTGFARPLTFSSNSDVTHRIVKIKNDLGYINFEYNLARVDLKNDVALTAVKLFDNSNTLIDQYNLSYDYFVATQLQGLSGFNMEDLDQRKYRLYLKNVTQSKNNLTNNKYEFTYNTAQQLPDRLSYSQDFWGYYNGQPNNFYYPSIQYVPVDGNSPDLSEDNNTIVTSQGGNRKVYPDYAKACILTKIKYPTGGTTEFEFESNRVIGDKNWLITTTEPEMVSVYGFMSYTAPPGEVQLNIPIPNPEKYIGGLTLSYNLLHNCSNSNAFDCPKIRIYKANNIDFTDVFISTTSIYGEKKIDLAPGQTSLRIEVSGYGIGIAGNPINHINFSINGHKLKPEDENGALAGGLRVKRIINKNTDQTTLTKKRYEYNQFDNPTKSSGLGMNLPVFMAYSKLMQIIVNPNNVQYIYANIINANPIFPLTNGSSYSAGYTNVTEYSEGAGSQGKTEYTFMFMADPNTGNVFKEYSLQAPTTDYSHRRGALLKKSVFSSNNSTYKLLQETINEYVGTDYGNNTSTNLVSENISNIKFNLKQYNNLAAPFYKINFQ
ncbi:hypothetical protein, partial [Flavobacterium sp. '19STA2R22 D10 B1']|uniref:hypothetical protein n=1 Tax=Flavobacterium aerium TaxID=3037261 RepID=UPI00278BD71B